MTHSMARSKVAHAARVRKAKALTNALSISHAFHFESPHCRHHHALQTNTILIPRVTMATAPKKNILERLAEGPIIGDGGFVFQLEKRGYVKAGPWTPEAAVEHPEAVRQLHREFLRAGSDVMQTFTFYASDDKLENR